MALLTERKCFKFAIYKHFVPPGRNPFVLHNRSSLRDEIHWLAQQVLPPRRNPLSCTTGPPYGTKSICLAQHVLPPGRNPFVLHNRSSRRGESIGLHNRSSRRDEIHWLAQHVVRDEVLLSLLRRSSMFIALTSIFLFRSARSDMWSHLSFSVDRLNSANKIARIKNRNTIFDSFQSCISK
jgi:hypothetical protein